MILSHPTRFDITTCRGAIGRLMAQVMEGHIRHHIIDPETPPTSEQTKAAEELIGVIRTCLR